MPLMERPGQLCRMAQVSIEGAIPQQNPFRQLVIAAGLGERTHRVYVAMVERPALDITDLAALLDMTEGMLREDLGRLVQASMIQRSGHPDAYRVTPPDQVVESLIARTRERIAEEEGVIAQARKALPALVQTYLRGRAGDTPQDQLAVLGDACAVRAQLFLLTTAATNTVRCMVPDGAFPQWETQVWLRVDEALLGRGVRLSVVTSRTSLESASWRSYLDRIVASGASVRVHPAPPLRLVIMDDDVAVVPRDQDDGAYLMRGRDLCVPPCSLYERIWAEGIPWHRAATADPEAVCLNRRHRQVLALLAEGLTDEGIARRMRCSSRTIGRLIAEIMRELQVASRFQVGVAACRLGLLKSAEAVPGQSSASIGEECRLSAGTEAN